MYEHVHFIVLNVFSFIVKSAVNQNASYQLLYDLIHPAPSVLRCMYHLFIFVLELSHVVIVNNSSVCFYFRASILALEDKKNN